MCHNTCVKKKFSLLSQTFEVLTRLYWGCFLTSSAWVWGFCSAHVRPSAPAATSSWCRCNTPVCRAAPPSAGRRNNLETERWSPDDSPTCGWTRRRKTRLLCSDMSQDDDREISTASFTVFNKCQELWLSAVWRTDCLLFEMEGSDRERKTETRRRRRRERERVWREN